MRARIVALLVPAVAAACRARPGRATIQRFEARIMGVRFALSIAARDRASAARAADEAFALARRIERIASDYDETSELSRLARAGAGRWQRLSPELTSLLADAFAVCEASGGAFDPALGALTRLWRRARRLGRAPSPAERAEARARAGHRLVEFDAAAHRIRFRKAGVRLDLGGIAKGWTADRMLALLAERGFPAALVDAGGDLAAGEAPPGRRGWRVAVAPLAGEGPPVWFLDLQRAAVATSGGAFQTILAGGRPSAHILDPRTGRGLARPFAATVHAPCGSLADAWATALAVLGPERGFPRLRAAGLEGLFLRRKAGAIELQHTPAFPGRPAEGTPR